MKLLIDTEAETVTVQGFTTTIEEAKHWARLHELDGYEVDFPKHWAHGLPHEEKIKELEQSMLKYERIEKEDGKTEHVVTFDPFNSNPNGLIFTKVKGGNLIESIGGVLNLDK